MNVVHEIKKLRGQQKLSNHYSVEYGKFTYKHCTQISAIKTITTSNIAVL